MVFDNRPFIGLMLVSLLAVGIGVFIARVGGDRDGIASRERLEIVWPNLMQMPDQDRALLAGLAMSCHLHDRDPDQASVLGCLKEAVESEHPFFPNSMDRKQAQDRLNQLIPPQSPRTNAA